MANESHTLKTGTERFFFALLRVTILNKELDVFKAGEKKYCTLLTHKKNTLFNFRAIIFLS